MQHMLDPVMRCIAGWPDRPRTSAVTNVRSSESAYLR